MKNRIPVTIVAARSAIGAAYRIPFRPNNLERISMDGISIRTCLSRVKNMALFGRPIAWKKFDPIIWKPKEGSSARSEEHVQ